MKKLPVLSASALEAPATAAAPVVESRARRPAQFLPADRRAADRANSAADAPHDISDFPRLHEGVPDYEKHRYGYPLEPGRLFGSGN